MSESADVSGSDPPRNLLTIDFEDWHQLTGIMWAGSGESRPAIMDRQLDRLLGLLAERGCRATFFCLGKSLAPFPRLIKRVADAGHEIATHGWEHQRIYRIGLDAFRADLERSIKWLSELTGREVLGHRAPAFSMTPEQLDGFFDICFESGLSYDSSVFPFRGRSYGIPGAPRHPHAVREAAGRKLIEVPLATVHWLGRRWAVAGGGWWRIMPTGLISAAIRRVNREGMPFTTYIHPYELDAALLNAIEAAGLSFRSVLWTIRQNVRRGSMYSKLSRILAAHRFGAVEDYLRGTGQI
jgi:polysaccharide deacetylase family protein (PEP-CTERM system associated)